MRKIVVFFILFSISVSYAVLPVISITPNKVVKKICYGCELQDTLFVSAVEGNESAEVVITVDNEIRNIVDFINYRFIVSPGSNKELEYVLSPSHVGLYTGRVSFETAEQQLNWINLSIDVSREYGQFLIEVYNEEDIVEEFDVYIYQEGLLINEEKDQRGYCLTDYFDFGEYTVLVRSENFVSSSKFVLLNQNQKHLIFDLESESSKILQISPKTVIIQTCESQETTLVTFENKDNETVYVSVSVPPYILSVNENNFTILPDSVYTLPVVINGLPRGNYTTKLNATFSEKIEQVNFNIIVYPKDSCEGRETISYVNYSTSVHMTVDRIRHVPVYIKAGEYSGKISIDASNGANSEIFPKLYNTLDPEDEVIFLVKITSPVSDFISLNIGTDIGSSFYPIKMYVSDALSSELVNEELEDLRELFEYLRVKVLDFTEQGYNTGDSLYLLNKGMIMLDQAEDILETNPVQAKNFINLAASDLNAIIEKTYSKNITRKFPYYLLFIPVVIIPIVVFIIRKRREHESDIKKKQKQNI